MSGKTSIEWTRGDDGAAGATWNPATGCEKVSPGCDHCYAQTFAERFRGTPGHYFENGFDLTLRPERLTLPLRWKRPRRVFVNSMSDLFHADIPDEYMARVFAVMAATPRHTYQILTKRHGRMRSFLRDECRCGAGHAPGVHLRSAMSWVVSTANPDRVEGITERQVYDAGWPLPNVWLGVSAEDQERAELRIPALLETPAAVRFVSVEPMLGPVDLTRLARRNGAFLDALSGDVADSDGTVYAAAPACLDWVICGGESGHGARPMHPAWARGLRDQAVGRGRAFFFKQWGEWGPARHRVEIDQAIIDRYTANRGDTAELDAAKSAAETVGATHGYAVWAHRHGWEPHRYTHKSWSGERGHLDESTHASIRRWGRKQAGRELDGRTWDEMPAVIKVEGGAR